MAQVFSGLLRRSADSAQPCVDYLLKHTEILSGLIDGCVLVCKHLVGTLIPARRLYLHVGRYKNAETALMTGSMLRDCLKNPALAKCEPTHSACVGEQRLLGVA